MTSTEPTSASATPVTPVGEKRNFGQQAAKLSWVAVLLACLVVHFSKGNPESAWFLTILGVALLVAGAVSGLVALFSIPKSGVKKVLAPALIGLSVSGFILAVAVPNFVRARNEALAAQSLPEDTTVTLTVSADQLAEGGDYEIEVAGKPISLSIPAGSRPEARLRIPAGSAQGGDLIFEFDVVPDASE